MPFGWHDAQTAFLVAVELTGAMIAAHGKAAGEGAGATFGGFGFGGAVGSGACHPTQNAAARTAATGFMPC
jgi:hypothetical protein